MATTHNLPDNRTLVKGYFQDGLFEMAIDLALVLVGCTLLLPDTSFILWYLPWMLIWLVLPQAKKQQIAPRGGVVQMPVSRRLPLRIAVLLGLLVLATLGLVLFTSQDRRPAWILGRPSGHVPPGHPASHLDTPDSCRNRLGCTAFPPGGGSRGGGCVRWAGSARLYAEVLRIRRSSRGGWHYRRAEHSQLEDRCAGPAHRRRNAHPDRGSFSLRCIQERASSVESERPALLKGLCACKWAPQCPCVEVPAAMSGLDGAQI